jgi:hypothetical protein
MAHEGLNRWYRDGYLARQNGKLRSANPKAQGTKKYWSSKAELWDRGWLHADSGVIALREWDQEQDILNELAEELSE